MPPVLQTARLLLRPPVWEDLEASHRIGSNPEVMRYIRKEGAHTWEESEEELVARMRFNTEPLGYWAVIRQQDQAFAGWITLRRLLQTKSIEVGFRLGQEFWGQGLATEAARRVLWYGFRELDLPRICAVVLPENHASIRVLEKCGLRLDGYGEYYDAYCMRLAVKKEVFIKQYRGY